MKRLILILTMVGLALAACAGEPDGDADNDSDLSLPEQDTAGEQEPPPREVEGEGQPLPPPSEDEGGEPVGDSDELAGPPLIRLVVGGEPVEGYQGSYCWTDPVAGLGLCADRIPPAFDTSIELPVGEPMRLQLDTPLPDTLIVSLERELFGEELLGESFSGAESIEWSFDVEPGQYILSVFASWESQGDVVYIFSVSIS